MKAVVIVKDQLDERISSLIHEQFESLQLIESNEYNNVRAVKVQLSRTQLGNKVKDPESIR